MLHVSCRRAQAQFLEHGGNGFNGAAAQIQGALLGQRRQAAIGLEVALQHEEVFHLLAIDERWIEGIVIGEDGAKAGADEIGAGDQEGQDFCADANFGFG